MFILIGHWYAIKTTLLFWNDWGPKGSKFQNFTYLKVCNFYFSSSFDVFFVVEWIVLRAFGSMSADFLHLLWFLRKSQNLSVWRNSSETLCQLYQTWMCFSLYLYLKCPFIRCFRNIHQKWEKNKPHPSLRKIVVLV